MRNRTRLERSNSVKSLIIETRVKAKLSPNISLKKPMSLAFGRFTILEKAKNLF
ncbi:hypothetical protein HMPREF1425_00593 [Helicobacter pylori GAM71Ai]|uniref:hypothetical protein n=1 Tax=Helicobacter pylori TaxID=210 RepID=UPI00026A20EF|nr:hypothetical protein [Helicobacter pylori]EJB50630.1 hypothetical protein HPHPH16_0804 [Helicobacter pylori Hp H-16]EMH36162.1 hypothetical protein HMPREF1425_00593 [Helicobacter pylori GAM71Ai]EMJ39095.1 hypothetical protein HMPREF1433_01507 [Helicobacter pylori GAMchJs117Ai]EMJ42878.1 hypothetical protein HMPREF1434_01407 [Helicobacter pylori GAMchJs124i]EMH02870.1 hypothetical protein HMPREF1406_00987 [Helicobacter pylori GAM239Bi]